MTKGANQNLGEQEGGHWQGDTAAFIDPLDQLAAMSPPPETTITRPPIREVIDQAVTIISSYPWAKEYAAQVEARITAAL